MKISAAIRSEHARQWELNEIVRDRVKSQIVLQLPQTWHFESRLKSLESFALKIETGRFQPRSLEDFFACTIVVPTLGDTRKAEDTVEKMFSVISRKPQSDVLAVSRANDFPFDHTRIYAHLRAPAGLSVQPLHEVKFEIQIKTFLQHAWSVATHDLTYKTTELSWGKERIAAQVKATLEAAEVSILEAETLAASGNRILGREDSGTTELVYVIRTLQQHFLGNLPDDMKRLAQTVRALLVACGLDLFTITSILEEGKSSRGGGHPTNLSPFATVLQYLGEQQPAALREALASADGPKVFIPDEVVLPPDFQLNVFPSAVRIT